MFHGNEDFRIVIGRDLYLKISETIQLYTRYKHEEAVVDRFGILGKRRNYVFETFAGLCVLILK